LNKADVPDALELAEFVKPDLEARGYKVFIISAISHSGLRELNFALAQLVEEARKAKESEPIKPRIQLMQQKRDENKFEIKREMVGDEEIFRILGVKPERWVQQTNFANEEAVGYLADLKINFSRLARRLVQQWLSAQDRELYLTGSQPLLQRAS
jgi:GTP-binding protein